MTVLVTTVVGLLVVVSLVALALPDRTAPRRFAVAVAVVLLGLLGLLAVVFGPVTTGSELVGQTLLIEIFAAAVIGGGPVTAGVLWLVDRDSHGAPSLDEAGQVLRGGAWIGVFERAAVFATLAAGWPEGLAVVLALKGLGRYAELRAPGTGPGSALGATPVRSGGGVAERFLIGSFASLLWACASAGAFLALVG